MVGWGCGMLGGCKGASVRGQGIQFVLLTPPAVLPTHPLRLGGAVVPRLRPYSAVPLVLMRNVNS